MVEQFLGYNVVLDKRGDYGLVHITGFYFFTIIFSRPAGLRPSAQVPPATHVGCSAVSFVFLFVSFIFAN